MNQFLAGRPIEILLVDDDPGDVDLMMEVLEMAKVVLTLNVVKDGLQALNYLRKKEKYRDASVPDLILLDLNMPRKDGRETLKEIKKDPVLCRIPVVILTTSDSENDISMTYSMGAACFITKPVGLEEFSRVVQSIENFWFTVVTLPPRE